MKCDFCHAPSVKWDYDAQDFELPLLDGRTFVSQGGWIACDECSSIIEQNGIPVLTAAVSERLTSTNGKSPEQWIASVKELQAQFLEFRTGPRKLLSDDERN